MNTAIELISIGTELLSGRTLNTHAQTLGAALTKIGLNLSRDTTIPDGVETIQSAVREAFERTDILIVSGGLGPTSDDITRDALAGFFGVEIVISEPALEQMKKRYAARGYPFTPAAERQALILEGAETLLNSAGAAPGERLALPDGKTLFVLPGPPNEFAAVLDDHIVPWLQKTFPDAAPDELRILTTQGIGESAMVTLLENENFQSLPALREPEGGISIGFYPGCACPAKLGERSGGKVEIRLSAPTEKKALLDETERTLRELLHDHLID